MTYTDFNTSYPSHYNHYMFIRSDTTMLFRFHMCECKFSIISIISIRQSHFKFNIHQKRTIYIRTCFSDDFLHTTVESAVLTSPTFQFNNEMICIQLLVGLCVECDAYVVLQDYTRDEVLVMVTVKGSSRAEAHGLPTWQSVKITKNFPAADYNNYNRVIIQLIPKLNKHSSNPLWAIANVRQCPQNGANLVTFYFLITFGIVLMLMVYLARVLNNY